MLWSHAYQNFRLCRSTSPVIPHSIRSARWGNQGSAWTAAYVPSHAPGAAVGVWTAESCRCRASCEGFWNTWRSCPHERRTTRCRRGIGRRQIPHATSPWVSPTNLPGRISFHSPSRAPRGILQLVSQKFGNVSPMPFLPAFRSSFSPPIRRFASHPYPAVPSPSPS